MPSAIIHAQKHVKPPLPAPSLTCVWVRLAQEALTHVICNREAFESGRVSQEMEEIFSRYPLKDDEASVKVTNLPFMFLLP